MVGGGHPGRLGGVDEVVLSGGVNGAERAVLAPRALGHEVVVGEKISVGHNLPQLECVDVTTQGVSCNPCLPPFTLPSFTALARLPDAFAPLCNRLPVQPARSIASVLLIGSPRMRPSLRHKQKSQLVGHLARSCTTNPTTRLWGAQCTAPVRC